MTSSADKSHFKTFQKIYETNKGEISRNEVKEAVEKKYHDRRMKITQKRPYMLRIFDPVIGCYFHDLLQQTGDRNEDGKDRPNYFHIFIESNSRYAFAYPVDKKDAKTAIETVQKLIEDNRPKPVVKLTSDGERGFESNEFMDFCKSKGIFVRIYNGNEHNSLGLIDRFIRTLRDMNQRQNKDEKDESNSIARNNFTEKEMERLIDEYNNTFHKTIGCSPKKMYDNPELEKEWIMKREKFKAVQKNIEDFVIPDGSYVRYRLNKADLGGRKRRTQFSTEKYKVNKRIGNKYLLIPYNSSGGQVISKSRFELILAEDKHPIGRDFYQEQVRVPDEVIKTSNGNYGRTKTSDGIWV